MASPPGSPPGGVPRPMSAMIRSNRSSSRMSMSSKHGGSRASDEDGKTAVKVVVRVRPPLRPTDPGFELIPQRFRGATCHVTTPTSLTVESAQGKKLFVFDRVFGEDVDQEGVWEYLSESVNSFIQGYNVSILAYGQSGAGKSYTMGTTGPGEQGDQKIMGVIPRAGALLFEKLTGTSSNRAPGSGIRAPSRYSTHGVSSLQSTSTSGDKGWQMKATYVEIYNETLRDLLLPESVPLSDRPQVTIREDTKGRILLTGLHQVNINSIDDLLGALNFGSSIRQTDATAVNARSSRSHAVFSLNLVQKKSKAPQTATHQKRHSVPIEAMSGSSGSESWVTVDSKLHFVDLAGSERLKNTGATGERAKEGISINAGLASLGKVISQLSTRSSSAHVSYRDSKLTRLLQDSLGGSAITYMIACVNPAEFHLSETLNTVQYAQRARAIQSKPQIQQVSDESDKQAIIDRLRAEVSFLRDQIRLSERTERRNNAPQERAERQQGREIELQNQLLDVQENYSALSQRHAKLISEITKARDTETESDDTPTLKDTIGDSALERLKRSNSFAEAVEQVVLEYEKTIQTLEASLSTTRSSLAASESTLLEKETKIAYMETVQQQLQARIQKAVDREASSEQYLRDLEAKVDGITSGEEKSSAIIQELRKELARTKENESSCEEYISTLEERLAEAEQDHEMMQREIERLEHVVERQRSIGKLDNLLYELDNIRQNDASVNGHSKKGSVAISHGRKLSNLSDAQGNEVNGREEHENLMSEHETSGDLEAVAEAGADESDNEEGVRTPALSTKGLAPADASQSPAQSKFVADKLESVTQELFDLRVEHESTVNDFDDLQRKYQIALNTLAELQDAVDEARNSGSQEAHSVLSSRPTSFLADAGVNGLREEDGQPSSSRTLSSELSLVGESSNTSLMEESSTTETSDAETAQVKADSAELAQKEAALAQEMESLKKLNAEKEEQMMELSRNYEQLHEKHQDTLDYVEELKSEVQKAQLAGPDSPSAQVIRRKSSQNMMTTDRANRSFASLRNMALEYFEEDPDAIQNFELNLNSLMTELHMRSERIQALEAEIASTRKEMETKMTIISGLTRERSSMKASSPMDMTMVASMQHQLMESENTLRVLKETHTAREQELQEQIEGLKASLEAHTTPPVSRAEKMPPSPVPGTFPITPAPEDGADKELGEEPVTDAHQEQIAQLEGQVTAWKTKHVAAMESTRASEKQLLTTIAELEASLKKAEALQNERALADGSAQGDFEAEKAKQDEVVAGLQKEVDEHKAAATLNATRLAELEQSHANILLQVEKDSKSRELTEKELETHRHLMLNLENQLEEHKSAIALHQQGLNSLQESHAKEIQEMLSAHTESNEKLAAQLAEHKDAAAVLQEQLAQAQAEQEESTTTLQAELTKAEMEMVQLLKGLSAALEEETDAVKVQSQIETLVQERKDLLQKHKQASEELVNAREELEIARASVTALEGKVGELKLINEETLRELELISEKEKKSSRLVEELEDQLSSNYDQHQMTNNRLSAIQAERETALEGARRAKADMEREIEESRARIIFLESQLGDAKRNSHRESLDPRDSLQRSNSATSNLRKSTSHNSLPSPPPVIPLPPLPGSPPAVSGASNAPSPPNSRHQSKDIAQAQLVEDQEARIRTIEKHLFAEKQLTATLEEALTDLEASSTKAKGEMEAWKKKCASLEEELEVMKKERSLARHSLQAVEEERNARMRVEAERAHLEARMAALNKKKKKGTLNCF